MEDALIRIIGVFAPVAAGRIQRLRVMAAALKRIRIYRKMFNRDDPHERALLKRLVAKEIAKARA